jgi:TolB protein
MLAFTREGLFLRYNLIRPLIIAATLAIAGNMPAGADPLIQQPVIRINEPVRIALPDFVAASLSEIELANSISRVIASDLKQSGAFELVDQVASLNKNVKIDAPPNFSEWRRTSTEELFVGYITRQPDARIKVQFRLWDIPNGAQLAAHQYIGNSDDLNRIGHMISGEIYERITHKERTFE